GFRRERGQTFYNQSATRSQKASYTLGSDQIGQFIRFFLDTAGPGSVFWAPGWLGLGTLLYDAASGDGALRRPDVSPLQVGDHLAITNDTPGYFPITVASVTPPNDIETEESFPEDYFAGSTCIFPLFLARLEKPLISISWKSPAAASCQIEW